MTNDITIITAGPDDKGFELCLQEKKVRDLAKNARDFFSNLQSELDVLDGDLKDGLSYLDMKNDTLLSYMIDLCNIVLKKVRCDTISGHASVERSVHYRVILEKIKAIDQRLAYQLNKVITVPDGATGGDSAVNINNLDIEIKSDEHRSRETDEEDEDSESDNEENEDTNSIDGDSDDEDVDEDHDIHKSYRVKSSDKTPIGIYKPPKLRSVTYCESKDKSNERRDHNQFYQDDDAEQDIVDESNVRRDNERTRFEEENYTRLPDSNPKKAKRKARALSKKRFKGNKRKNKW